jgi:hypothetical protein
MLSTILQQQREGLPVSGSIVFKREMLCKIASWFNVAVQKCDSKGIEMKN